MSYNKYVYKPDVLLNEDDVSYYLLGAFLTDGCMSQDHSHLSISSIDEDWLQLISDTLITNSPIVKYYSDTYRLSISNKIISNWFISHGCIPAKSIIAKLPNIPEQYLPDFIRGCMDGDGSISFAQNKSQTYTSKTIQCCLSGSAPQFIIPLHNKLIELNYKHSFCIRTSKPNIINGRDVLEKHPHYIISFGGTSAYNFLKWVYYPNHKLSMKRKREKVLDCIGFFNEKLKKPYHGKNYFHKFSEEQIRDIKLLLSENIAATHIAAQFNTCQSSILNIKHGRTYK